MIQAVREGFRKYATFYGRASRRQFWMWVLAWLLVAILAGSLFLLLTVLAGISAGAGSQDGVYQSSDWLLTGFWGLSIIGLAILTSLLIIALVVPQLAFESRRLHDANISAWWLLLHLIPFGTTAILIMCCFPSKAQSLYENEGRPKSANADVWDTNQALNTKQDDWS